MSTQLPTMLSGIQPTNRLTLGNYLGALRNWVKLQHEYRCLFIAVDAHAITVRQDPAELREQTYRLIATYIAAGIEPQSPSKHDGACLFVQSHVTEHFELAWILNCFSYMGELGRMTQFKDKSAKQGENIAVGLFTYPVLMAADILLYQADMIPVGEDQKQHLELTRDIAIRVNNLFTKKSDTTPLFKIPKPYIPPVGARIMSLQNPTAKMSKSDTDANASVFMNDTNDQIAKKIKRAVTDSGTEITFEDAKPGIQNLLTIQSAITGKSIAELVAAYAGKQYGHLKVDTADIVVSCIGPIRDKTQDLMNNRDYLDQLLRQNAERARQTAHETLNRVREKVGFIKR